MSINIIKKIERHYNIKLNQILEEKDKDYTQVEFYKNNDTYSVDNFGNVIKLNLRDNNLGNLNGLKELYETVTHLNLAATRIEDISVLKNFKRLKFVDLSTNSISNIRAISEHKELISLYLDNNIISEIPDLDLPNLIELWMYSNRIESIKGLRLLSSLESLNLAENNISDISALSNLKSLKKISLGKNRINDIAALSHLKKVLSIDLSNNLIVNIEALSNIVIDNELLIGQNKIFDLSPVYYSLKAQNIYFVNVFQNPLEYPPIEIAIKGETYIVEWFDQVIASVNDKLLQNNNSGNQILDLGNLGLTDLSMIPGLFKLKHVKELRLSNEWAEFDEVKNEWVRKESSNSGYRNNLYNIPADISKLNNLEKLITGGDWKSKNSKKPNTNWRLKEASNLFKLKKLKYLNISNNHIQNIDGILSLSDLEIAHINNNCIQAVPDISKLLKLSEIYLSNNNISSIKFLKKCVNLKTVDLHSNKISNLVPLEELLRNSGTNIALKDSSWEKGAISVSKNQKSIIPPYEIIKQGNEGFFLYLKLLRYEDVLKLAPYHNNEIKIILVGNSNSGKSTILNYLKTKRFKKNLPVTHWLVTEELQDFKIDGQAYKLRFFDFGGHDYYHDTHKIFFSSGSTYLLLWDDKSNFLGEIEETRTASRDKIQVYPLEYWLDSIKIYAKKSMSESQRQMERLLDQRDRNVKSKGLKNQTLVDNVVNLPAVDDKNNEDRNILVIQNKIEVSHRHLNQYKLTREYPSIYDYVNMSLLNKQGKRQFEELYLEVLKNNLNFRKPLLATWGYIKDNWNSIFMNDDFIIDVVSFRNKVNNYLSVWLRDELKKNENEIDKILFEEDDIVLLAKFLREIGLVIYNPDQTELKNSIIVHQNKFLNEVYKILDISKLNMGRISDNDLEYVNHKDLVIQTLIKHNIIFKWKNDSNYIAPLYLPEKPNLLIDLLADVTIPFRRFKFKGFIPKSIILSIFSEVVNNQEISAEDFYYWKNGLIFKDKLTSQKVFLKFHIGYEFGCAYIDLFNFASNLSDLYIRKFTGVIKAAIEKDGVEVDEMLTLDGKFFVKLEKLLFNYENKINYITVKDFINKERKQINVYSFNKLLEDKMKKPSKKLFISYSKQDEKIVNSFIDHLSSLQSSGVIESWYCTELKAGEDWDSKIKQKLNEADLVCFMISPKFMSTPYIHKYEVKQAFKRYQAGEDVKIIPIILDYVDWSRSYHFTSDLGEEFAWSLGKFTALPFTGKEIREFKNENKAWYLVANAIKTVIEEDLNSEKDEDEIVRKFPPAIKKIYEEIIEDKV